MKPQPSSVLIVDDNEDICSLLPFIVVGFGTLR